MTRHRFDLIRARLSAGGYGHTAGLDIAYLMGVIEMMERLWDAERIARMDPDNAPESDEDNT